MPAPDSRPWGRHLSFGSVIGAIRQGYSQFLALPTVVLGVFLLLAAATYALDRIDTTGALSLTGLGAVRTFLRRLIFSNPSATASLLGTVAGSVITVTSITFSMLLLAVQQSAASLSNQVYDQFLRRRENQFYFGFFVGLAVYSLVILSTVNPPFNPIIGGTVALVLAFIGLCLLVVLLYSTINQMHPVVIVAAIHAHMLEARHHELRLLAKTRRTPWRIGSLALPVRLPVRMRATGFVTGFAIDHLGQEIARAHAEVEVEMLVTVGSFVVYDRPVAWVRAASREDAERVVYAVRRAITLGVLRDVTRDPGFGIQEVATIGWTAISTAKANPTTGLLAIETLHDVLARWVGQREDDMDDSDAHDGDADDHGSRRASVDGHVRRDGDEGESTAGVYPVVYPVVYPDPVVEHALDALGSLVVPSSASRQFQSLAAIVRALADLFAAFPPDLQRRAESIIRVMLPTLGDQLLTPELDDALTLLMHTLHDSDYAQTASSLQRARDELAARLGHLDTRRDTRRDTRQDTRQVQASEQT